MRGDRPAFLPFFPLLIAILSAAGLLAVDPGNASKEFASGRGFKPDAPPSCKKLKCHTEDPDIPSHLLTEASLVGFKVSYIRNTHRPSCLPF